MFDDKYFNKKNLFIFLIVVLIIIVFFWILSSFMFRQASIKIATENFSGEQVQTEQQIPIKNAPAEEKVDQNNPYINPKTGILVDGPGYETGPVVGTSEHDAFATIPSNYYFLDDGAGGEMSIQHNLCSKSCCSAQWPTPFKMDYDPYVCQNADKFVPSDMMCNNTFQDAGCLCLTKQQAEFLYRRGGNGLEWF